MTHAVVEAFDIPAEPGRVREIRRWLSGLPGLAETSIADDIVLLACELVTNAIRHSDSARCDTRGDPGRVSITIYDTGEVVRIEVAAVFHVDPKTVTRWANEGRLTFVRTLGGHRRYRKTEIHALLTEHSEMDTYPGDGERG